MGTALLHTQNCSIGYSDKKTTRIIAKDIDLEIKSGKLVAIIGANGIGKSTLLRTLSGIQPVLSGCVFLENREIESYAPSELALKISLVLTDKIPQANLTIRELVAIGRQPYTNWIGKLTADDILAINGAIKSCGIESIADRKIYELSDGQFQIAMLARALSQQTPLIVLDEPSTHLDLQNKARLFKLLRNLCSQQKKTIVFSTHDIELALELGDELIVLTADGIYQKTPGELLEGNYLNTLFNDPDIRFDREKSRFVFKYF